jgi:hypothetical protein
MKRVTPMRQIEMAEIMISFNNYSASYAKCLYVATPPEQRLVNDAPAAEEGVSPEDQARMGKEMLELRRNYKVIEETHGDNVLRLTLAGAYVRGLLNNARVVRYLSRRHTEILAEFQRVIDSQELTAPPAKEEP